MLVQTWVAECARNVGYICHWGASFFEDVPLVEFMYLIFTCMPGESYCRQLSSLLLSLCYVVQAQINSLVGGLWKAGLRAQGRTLYCAFWILMWKILYAFPRKTWLR